MRGKKFLVAVLGLTMLASMCSGCGKSEGNTAPSDSEHTSGTETVKTEAAGTETAAADSTGEEAAGTGDLPYEGVTITFAKDTDSSSEGVEAVIALAKEKLGLNVELELIPGGAEGDNLIRTRLASGDMPDLQSYNSGSLFYALNPEEYFMDLTGESFIDTLDENFVKSTSVNGKPYGIPLFASQAGAIVYYKPIYEELNLDIPKTWDEFLENCKKIKEAGKVAMIGTCADSWTAQLIFFGDNYNALKKVPDFPEKFDAGEMKFATTPAMVESFDKYADLIGYYNEDYLAATYNDGCDMIATGQGAHWPALTQVLGNIANLYPDAIDDIGVFGIPGDDPDDVGLTLWMPNGIYANKNAENPDAVKAFMELYVSKDGLDAYCGKELPNGPVVVKDYVMPDNTYPAVKDDMMAYLNAGKTSPVLDNLVKVKGLECPTICVECTTGELTGEEAAAAYDEDCKKQAIQMGLDW